VKFKNKQ